VVSAFGTTKALEAACLPGNTCDSILDLTGFPDPVPDGPKRLITAKVDDSEVFGVAMDGTVRAPRMSATGGFPAALIASGRAGTNDRAALLRGHSTIPGTEISNDGGGPALQVTSEGRGIQITSKTDAIVALAGRIIANDGFRGPCPAPFCNADIAEAFRTEVETEAGDVVMLMASEHEPSVQKTMRAYESALVGVVSTSPGLVLDQGMTRLAGDNTGLVTPTKTVVAMLGRVPTKVSMENGAIEVGDALTSSSTPGIAMRATKAGRILGYALEPAVSEGNVLAWLEPGYYLPPGAVDKINQLLAGDE
jgi:hypothetical protein